MSTRVRTRKHRPGVYLGSITIACSPDTGGVGSVGIDGGITVGAFGSSQADALHKASLLAERIVNDPVMKAILPPQAAAAIMATKKLATAAKRGKRALNSLWGQLRGKGKKRLAKALAKEQQRKVKAPRSRPRPMPAPMPEAYADEEYDDGPSDEEIMDPEPAPELAPMPEDALGPMPYPGDGGQGGDPVDDQGDDFGDEDSE